jgi:IMP cyclohydrolase
MFWKKSHPMLAEFFAGKRYPGRFLVVGRDAGAYVLIYGATGRSPSSLARRFVQKDNAIYMGGIDETVQKEGNPELLEYPAMKILDTGIVVANGRQIEKITEFQNREAKKQLSYALSDEAYEPDEYRTPRITGCIVKTDKGMDAAIHIVRSAEDGIDHSSWTVPLQNGEGKYISTYGGADIKPTPSFSGEPLSFPLAYGSAKNAAKEIFAALAPAKNEMDYRVGVFAVYAQEGQEPEIAIANRR